YDLLTNQYYLKARYYNPVIGRFTQMDTYHGDGLNLYAYVGNNPVRYVDPSGHDKIIATCKDGSVSGGAVLLD
ncbi:MAG: RHS repeat-associated core domain-containing protein, partial [Lachnospiraceae bacterium]|nr:RHS repeat-associated core domain-containing protein [Lachnospiraceae bacterium]